MTIMRVSLVESLCQTTLGWIPALEYMLLGALGLLWLRLIASDSKWHRFLRPGADRAYPLLKALERGDWMPGPIPGRLGRRNRQTGGAIL
jgi:hypothetical protein